LQENVEENEREPCPEFLRQGNKRRLDGEYKINSYRKYSKRVCTIC